MSRKHSLPIVLGQTAGQSFDCHGCTHCCRELVVRLLPSDRERLDARAWHRVLGVKPYVKLHGEYMLNKRPDGRCVFLEDDGKCRIHREHGGREKPLACQLYPFRIVPAAKMWRIGWRFDCPTIARSEGRPVHTHETGVRKLASGLTVEGLDEGASRSHPDIFDEAAAAAVVRVGESWLNRSDVPLLRQVSVLVSLASVLADPAFSAAGGAEMVPLIDSLGRALGETEDRELEPASARQCAMLRQAAFAHCEHLSLADALSLRRRMGLRFKQLSKARRFRKGTGFVPAIEQSDRVVSFEEVEAVRPAQEEAARIDGLIARYLRVILDSRAFYGQAYYGWSVPEGLAALMLRLPITGWLARYHAAVAGREAVAFEDVVSALGRVDGSAGRLKSLGSPAERLRLKYLLRDRGLMRLIMAYPLSSQTEAQL